eukprot:1151986-Pelagomonas_calceolata.AAC.1
MDGLHMSQYCMNLRIFKGLASEGAPRGHMHAHIAVPVQAGKNAADQGACSCLAPQHSMHAMHWEHCA